MPGGRTPVESLACAGMTTTHTPPTHVLALRTQPMTRPLQPDKPIPLPPTPVPPGRQPTIEDFKLPRTLERPLWTRYRTLLHVHKPPADAPAGKLPVLYLHGIQSHPAWFYASARALADAGHAVYQLTRRGSGGNRKQRGHAQSAFQLHRDLRYAADAICRREGVEKLHLVGVSWGGKWAAAALCKSSRLRALTASVTLVAPGIVSQVDVPRRTKLKVIAVFGLMMTLVVLLFIIAPPLLAGTGPWSSALVLGLSLLYIAVAARLDLLTAPLPLDAPSLFTDNPAMREYIRTDTFSLRRATVQFLLVSRWMDRQIRPSRSVWDVPTTLILSKHDRIIDNEATRRTVERHVAGRLEVVELDGEHTLEFEPDPGPFFDRLVKALERRLPQNCQEHAGRTVLGM